MVRMQNEATILRPSNVVMPSLGLRTVDVTGERLLEPRTGFSNYGNVSFSYTQGCNPNIINTLNDQTKIKRKIYMPKTNKFNYTGLIIGPKGSNQKRLEDETGCKILVRGKGSQKDGQPPQPDDNEDLHV